MYALNVWIARCFTEMTKKRSACVTVGAFSAVGEGQDSGGLVEVFGAEHSELCFLYSHDGHSPSLFSTGAWHLHFSQTGC